ncbi:MAG: hypothetical protein MZV63_72165 [Marinilabiliales bacterium]|nr:hypothetical protein [Marinilabiliales bacterium]
MPESLVIDWENCTKCGECVKAASEGMIDLNEEAHEFDVNVGAVVMATGFKPYEPFYGEMGWKEFPEVITLPQLHRLLDDEGPSDGKFYWNGHPVRDVAIIHCVGSRQIEGVHRPQPDGNVNNYCSRVCCTASMSMAALIRQKALDTKVYEHLRRYPHVWARTRRLLPQRRQGTGNLPALFRGRNPRSGAGLMKATTAPPAGQGQGSFDLGRGNRTAGGPGGVSRRDDAQSGRTT